MESLNIILISLLSFVCVLLVSAILDSLFFSEPNKREDTLLVVIKLIIEISIICLITYLIILNVDDITKLLNLSNNNLVLIPITIVWVLSINYYFKNKIFGKLDILFNKFFSRFFKKSNSKDIQLFIFGEQSNDNEQDSNNGTNSKNTKNKGSLYKNELKDLSNNNIFKKHHNLNSYLDFFNIRKYYPELEYEDNSNIKSGEYKYLELNNLRNNYNINN